jgi:nitrite reductase/ring-hydroxylating ferredoxin subunit
MPNTEDHRLCHLDEVADGDSNCFVRKTVDGLRSYMAIRQGNMIFVYINACPHIGLPLDLKPGHFLNAAIPD